MNTIRQLKRNAHLQRKHNWLSEREFKRVLRSSKIAFKHQKVIGRYIVDFYLPDRMLIVEIDGSRHKNTVLYDRKREKFLKSIGFIVLRIDNDTVYKFPASCIDEILKNESSNLNKNESNKILSRVNSKILWKNMVGKRKKRDEEICGHGRLRRWCTDCRYNTVWK